MTRWARAGNSQKHQKMPEDATSWAELSKHIRKSKATKKVKEKQFSTGIPSSVKSEGDVLKTNIIKSEGTSNEPNSPTNKQNLNDSSDAFFPMNKFQEINHSQSQIAENLSSIRPIKKRNRQKSDKTETNMEFSHNDIESDAAPKVSDNFDSVIQTNNISEKKMKKINSKDHSKKQNSNTNLPNPLCNDDDNQNPAEVSANKKSLMRKEYFKKQLLEKRKKNGITLLPPKTEQKLYRLRKKLRYKGFAPDVIKSIIRKQRRKAELSYRNLSSKICFNCRQNGHVLSECPMPIKDANSGVGLCFKCGSLEHTSTRCKKKVVGYPFATCFICKAEGHISRDCPSNTHGIYPKGGRCNLCDNVNHLRKDCPSIKKKENETAVTLQTINDVTSIDDEMIDSGNKKSKNSSKKLKVVKF